MSSSSSDEDVFIFSALLNAEEQEKKTKRSCWVHEINRKREELGEFHHLFSDLKRDKKKFFKYFRMSEEKFYELLDLIKDNITRQNTRFRKAVTSEERLAVCLRFLATGDSFGTIAFSFRLGETTVRNIVYETCKAIWEALAPIVMPEMTREMWKNKEAEFLSKWNFPNCLGAIDGKHVVFQKPNESGTLYFNYKKTCSIVLLALVDANYKFIIIDVGAYGKNSDGGIFANSLFGRRFFSGELDFPSDKPLPGTWMPIPHVIVGDEAFPLHKNLMRPYPGSQLSGHVDKKVFNYRLSRARNVSEDAFGILTKKFRIYQRRLEMTPEHLDIIVMATCCLHNFLRDDSESLLAETSENEEPSKDLCLQNLNKIGGPSSGESMLIREKFKEYFSSPAGEVPWQMQIVQKGMKNV